MYGCRGARAGGSGVNREKISERESIDDMSFLHLTIKQQDLFQHIYPDDLWKFM